MGNHHKWAGRHHHGWSVGKIIAATIGGTILAVVLGFGFGWVIEHLWNWLMPSLFGLKAITYWQGFGLFVLAKILFGCGVPGGSPHHSKRHHGHGSCNGDDDCGDVWKVRGSHKDWKYYDKYWKEEGKAAFEGYLERMEGKKEGKNE